jgi:hypothetical protein
MKKLISIIISILFNFSVSFAESFHFPDITPTNTWIHFVGKLAINNHDPVNNTDEIAVFVDDGNGGELMVGKTIVGTNANNYYFISVFGNETQTIQKEGAVAGDTLIFKVWSSQYNIEKTISHNQFSFEQASGLTQPDLPPVYQSPERGQFGYLHISCSTNISEKNSNYSIPTNSEWGTLCFMSILIAIAICYLRKRSIV